MNDYAELYYKLFNKITDVIHELQLVQQQVEDAYISLQPDQIPLPVPVLPADVPVSVLAANAPVSALTANAPPTNVLPLKAHHMQNENARLPEIHSAKAGG